MTTNYDPIAEQYRRAKQQPWRAHIESFTLMNLIGDPAGQSVIDIACGEGFYTRLIRQRGAGRVTGVDLSEQMIALARDSEAEQGLGIDYAVGDARTLPAHAEYDLAVAAYLLNYARNRVELAEMCNAVARCLRPGGRFVTVNANPALDFSSAPSYRMYGFETTVMGKFAEGVPITWTFHLEDGPFNIENYFLDVQAHNSALHDAGFREVRWHQPMLSPEGANSADPGHWATFLEHSPIAFIECVL